MSKKSWGLIFILAFIWGGSFLATAYGLDAVSFTRLVAYRVSVAALALWLIVFMQRQPTGLTKAHTIPLFLIGLVNVALPFALITWGMVTVASGLAGILNATTAMSTTVLAALVFAHERLTLQKSLGTLIGLAGVIVTMGWGNLSQLGLDQIGQYAIILAGICYAIGIVTSRIYLADVRPTASAAGMTSAAALIMIPASLFFDGIPHLSIPMVNLIAIAYTALVATALAYYLFFLILRSDGASNVQYVTLLVPAVAIILGALFRHEALPLRIYLGFAIISVGLLIIDGRLLGSLHRALFKAAAKV